MPLIESGLAKHIMNKHMPPIPKQCLPSSQKPQGAIPLTIADFYGVFALLLIGYGLGNIVLIVEFIVNKLKH